jgi:hypothetical protein
MLGPEWVLKKKTKAISIKYPKHRDIVSKLMIAEKCPFGLLDCVAQLVRREILGHCHS